jgi:hypothetical protein
MTKLTQNGVSTTTAPGQEQWETFMAAGRKCYVQYDYRHTDGELFSCMGKTLGACREQRDAWLNRKEA